MSENTKRMTYCRKIKIFCPLLAKILSEKSENTGVCRKIYKIIILAEKTNMEIMTYYEKLKVLACRKLLLSYITSERVWLQGGMI